MNNAIRRMMCGIKMLLKANLENEIRSLWYFVKSLTNLSRYFFKKN